MTEHQLQSLLKQSESETLEFKQSFSKAVFETIVAFSNVRGGNCHWSKIRLRNKTDSYTLQRPWNITPKNKYY